LSFGGHGGHTAVGVHELTRLLDHQSTSPVEVEHDAQRLKVNRNGTVTIATSGATPTMAPRLAAGEDRARSFVSAPGENWSTCAG
jgi:hypothetical protein